MLCGLVLRCVVLCCVVFCFALCCVVAGGKYVDWREHGGGAAD